MAWRRAEVLLSTDAHTRCWVMDLQVLQLVVVSMWLACCICSPCAPGLDTVSPAFLNGVGAVCCTCSTDLRRPWLACCICSPRAPGLDTVSPAFLSGVGSVYMCCILCSTDLRRASCSLGLVHISPVRAGSHRRWASCNLSRRIAIV